MGVGRTEPEAAEFYSPVIRYSSELGDRQVHLLLAHKNAFILSWGEKKLPFNFFFLIYIYI